MNFEELAASLKSGSGMQRAQSAQDLGKLRDRRAIRPLMVALGDKSSAVRNNAAFALAELGASEAVPGIIPLLMPPVAPMESILLMPSSRKPQMFAR